MMYWKIGEIVTTYKEENNSKYGDLVISNFSTILSAKYGKGFDKTNIARMGKFYRLFSIGDTCHLSIDVTWSHLRELLKFHDLKVIDYYLDQIKIKQLTVKELIEAINSNKFGRTIYNQKNTNTENIIEHQLVDPIILGIKNKKRTEKQLEEDILSNVFVLMNELGSQVSLLGRQYKINVNPLIHKVDLVFVDNNIEAYILIDLKIGKVTNRDVFQMKMYEEHFCKTNSNNNFKTYGLILCETKDSRLVKSDDIYQIKYLNEMPKKEELEKIINENKIILLKTEKLEV